MRNIALCLLLAEVTLCAQPIQFKSQSVFASEGANSAVLVAVRIWSLPGTMTAQFHAVDGTAKAGEDYASVSGTLTFPDAGSEQTIVVPLLQNCVREDTEQFAVFITGIKHEGKLVEEPTTAATVFVADDDSTGVIERELPMPEGRFASMILPIANGQYLVRLNNSGAAGGLLRLRSDFTVDPSFQLEMPEDPEFRRAITHCVVSKSGRIAVTAASLDTEGFFIHWLGTFEPDGRLLSWQQVSYHPDSFSGALAWDAEERLLYGWFDIKRYSHTGVPETGFAAPSDLFPIFGIALQPDGRILVNNYTNLVRLHANGALDTSFSPSGQGQYGGFHLYFNYPSTLPHPILVLPDGRVLVSRLNFDGPNNLVAEVVCLDSNGSLLYTRPLGVMLWDGYPRGCRQLVRQEDGSVLVGGWFQVLVGGELRKGLLRLRPDGTVDPAFAVGFPLDGMDWLGIDGRGNTFLGESARVFDGSRLLLLGRQQPTRFESITRGGPTVICRANAVLGGKYTLQSSADLVDWQDLVTSQATSCVVSFTNAATATKAFFRLRREE